MTARRTVFPLLQGITLPVLLACAMAAMVHAPHFRVQSDPDVFNGIFVGLELLAYLFFLMGFFPRIEIFQAIFYSVLAVAVRSALAFVAAFALYGISGADSPIVEFGAESLWISLWIGHPMLTALQVLLMAAVLIPYLGIATPRSVGEMGRPAGVRSDTLQEITGTAEIQRPVNLPVGGFIQCYSYQELHDCIRKLPGLLGFALASEEGLIVLDEGRSLPFPLESVIPRLQVGAAQLEESQKRSGLPTEQMWQSSSDFTQLMVPLRPSFLLVAYFGPEVDLQDLRPRVESVRRSAETFLMERHSLMHEHEEELQPV